MSSFIKATIIAIASIGFTTPTSLSVSAVREHEGPGFAIPSLLTPSPPQISPVNNLQAPLRGSTVSTSKKRPVSVSVAVLPTPVTGPPTLHPLVPL
ncbi:hypothetical protein HDU76_004478, partial [Blyttiomyces sp. JEL0837]